MDLTNDNIRKLFFKYLLPSISATLVTSIYVLADTIIIGRGVGANGIAALNIVLPIYSLFFGTGILLGVGGAVLMSFANGKGDRKLANSYFTSSVILAVAFSILYLTIGFLFFDKIVHLLGANEDNIALVKEYGKYVVLGSPLFLSSNFLQAFIRNDKAPKLAMVGIITGGVLNVILDYIFVFELNMSISGAAIATLMGTSITVIILLSHFLSKNNNMKLIKNSFKFKIGIDILQSGVSSFIIEMASGIVIFLFNLQLLKYIGNIGVIVYGIISNSAIVAMSLFNGVAQAAQPIMAINFGANKIKRVLEVKRFAIITAVIIGMTLFLIGFGFPKTIISIFIDLTPEIISLGTKAIRIYFIGFLVMGLNIFYITYFQSIMQPKISLFICLLRGFILSTIFVFVLPLFFKVTGIWLTMPITEFITVIVCFITVKRHNKLALS